MNLGAQTKVLLLIAGILVFILVINSYNKILPIQNEGNLSLSEYPTLDNVPDNKLPQNIPPKMEEETKPVKSNLPEEEYIDEEKLRRKFKSKNRSMDGFVKKSNYVEGKRGNGPSDFDDYFDENNDMVKDVYMGNDQFSPNDETNGKLASYKSGKKRKITDEDIFRAEDYLPQEMNKDWFEVMPEPISVKNRHLINISRPVGINTVGTTLKNPSYDIRGTPPCPKFVVSPWLQSSYEPDINNKGLCNWP